MNPIYPVLLIPLLGVPLLSLIGHSRRAGLVNVLFTAADFAASLWLAQQVHQHGLLMSPGRQLFVDPFNVYLIVLTTFVGLTTALFSTPYMEHERARGRVSSRQLQLYHASYQGFMLAMLLTLSTNNMGVMWVAMEGATLATVLLVSLYRTPESIEAAWKYFILCGVGIAQALFGTVLLYFAASDSDLPSDDRLLWTVLNVHSASFDPVVMMLAFVFLLVGYGTKVGLVPLHNWLPDAHSEGPTPMSAILSGLLLNDALYAVVRSKMLVDGAVHNPLPGELMMGFGLLSFLVAALFLHRQHDIKRLFSYSSIEHMGLMTFAFGIGGPLATFGALLHMAVHSLTKSAIFVTVGHAAQLAGSQQIDRIRGLIRSQPGIGWGLMIGTVAIAGFPPFGVFTSEFLLLSATMKSWPWLVVPLLAGIAVACAGLFRHLQPMVYGAAPEGQRPIAANMTAVYLHLVLVLWLGLAIPDLLARWFAEATTLIAGSSPL